jgi:hypothetical protein
MSWKCMALGTLSCCIHPGGTKGPGECGDRQADGVWSSDLAAAGGTEDAGTSLLGSRGSVILLEAFKRCLSGSSEAAVAAVEPPGHAESDWVASSRVALFLGLPLLLGAAEAASVAVAEEALATVGMQRSQADADQTVHERARTPGKV